jgi:hypothetical protein
MHANTLSSACCTASTAVRSCCCCSTSATMVAAGEPSGTPAQSCSAQLKALSARCLDALQVIMHKHAGASNGREHEDPYLDACTKAYGKRIELGRGESGGPLLMRARDSSSSKHSTYTGGSCSSVMPVKRRSRGGRSSQLTWSRTLAYSAAQAVTWPLSCATCTMTINASDHLPN